MPHRYVGRLLRRFWHSLGRQPVLTSLVLFTIVASVGYWAQQQTIEDLNRQVDCNSKAWSLLAAMVVADNAPWDSQHWVLAQNANEHDYLVWRQAVNARHRLSDDFVLAIERAAESCGKPLPLIPPEVQPTTDWPAQ